jgi:uncharacterized protein (DUF433 family)
MPRHALLERIATDQNVMVGQPCIRGTRLTVHYILNLLGNGSTIEEILDEYQRLKREDILACLLFASAILERWNSSKLSTILEWDAASE